MATIVPNNRIVARVCLSLFFAIVTTEGKPQQSAQKLQTAVVIHKATIQLDSLLHLITKQTGVKFSLNTRKFPATKLIHLKNNKHTIETLLQKIQQVTGIYYALLGDHIIFLDKPPLAQKEPRDHDKKVSAVVRPVTPQKRSPSKIKNTTVKRSYEKPGDAARQEIVNHASVSGKQAVPGTSRIAQSNIKTNIAPADTSVIKIQDTATLQRQLTVTSGNDPVIQKPAAINQPAVNSYSSSSKTTLKRRGSVEKKLFIKGGLVTNDIFYFSPTLHIGYRGVYGIASYNINFGFYGVRYGAGFSIPLKENWRLHFQATTSNLSSPFDSIHLVTTNQHTPQFKAQLRSAGIIAETNLGHRFKMQFGPVLNLMTWTFYRNGERTAPGFGEANVKQNFRLIYPIYTISDNYSANSSRSTKIWIGLQASIFYNLFLFKSP